jgi:hypothetical protein
VTDWKATRVLLLIILGLVVGYVACFLFDLTRADAQGVGFFGTAATGTRTNCSQITNPVVGQTVCFEQSANKWKVWNGTTWVQPPTDVINVRDFGAVDDGVTDSCAPSNNALQKAVDAATSTSINGGIVYIPTANVRWLCSSGVQVFATVTAAPLAIVGDGKWATVLRYTGTGSWLSSTNGAAASQVRLENFSVQLTNSGAIGINASQFISSTIRSIRLAWSGAGVGATGIASNPSQAGNTPFFNVIDDVTFDGVASGIVLNTTSVTAPPNRWRILAPTFLAPGVGNTTNGIVIGNNSTSLIAGTDIVTPYCDQIGGTCITLGNNSDRTTIVAARLETAQGGSLFSINGAANRTTILGYHVHAGTVGALAGTRTVFWGGWDDLHIGSSVNGGANLLDINNSAANGGLTVGQATGGDRGLGTVNLASSVLINSVPMFRSGAPTCSNNCGTSPSVTGNNSAMRVTMGATGTPRSPFLVLFSTPWNAAPACIAQLTTATTTTVSVTNATTTGVTVNTLVGPAQGDVYAIVCPGVG